MSADRHAVAYPGRRPALGRAATIAGLSLAAVLFLLPIAWWASSATRGSAALQPGGSLLDVWIPDRFALFDNLEHAFHLYPMHTFLLNSVLVASVVTVCEVLLSAGAGYAFAKLRFAGREVLFRVLMALLLVPQIVLVIPLFELIADAGLTNTYAALIVPFLVTPFGVFMMRQFMLAIPSAYLEAARLEGAGELRIFASIVLPMARNACLTLGIFTFLLQWDSLLWPLIATSEEARYTLPVGVSLLQTNVQVPYNAIYAVTLLFSLPVLLVYLFMQRQFMRSMAMSGLKG